jgi:hypothetical protein
VQRAQGQVALRHGLDDHAKAVDVEHLRERQVLVGHLAVDAVQRLLAAVHLGGTPASGRLFCTASRMRLSTSRRLPRAASIALRSTL